MSIESRRRAIIEAMKSDTPPIYQNVEYIESTGTQYIDTGYSGEFSIDIGFFLDLSDTSAHRQDTVFGCQNNGSPWGATALGRTNAAAASGRFIVFSGQPRITDLYIPASNFSVQAVVFLDKAKLTINGSVKQDATVTGTLLNPHNLYLMAMNTGGAVDSNSYAKMKLHYAKIYSDKDMSVLVRDFVPCYRKPDGAIGLYDKVTKNFFTNAGTGNFLKGADVN